MGVTAEALDRIGIALLDRSQRPDQEDQRQYHQRNREIHRIPLRPSLSPPIASLLRQWPRRATEKRTTPIDPAPRSLLYVPASHACAPDKALMEIGRASCRERGCQTVSISVVAVSLKKKN